MRRLTTLSELIQGLSQRNQARVWMHFTTRGVQEFSYLELADQSRRLANGLVPLTHGNLVFQLNVILDAGIVSEVDRVCFPCRFITS